MSLQQSFKSLVGIAGRVFARVNHGIIDHAEGCEGEVRRAPAQKELMAQLPMDPNLKDFYTQGLSVFKGINPASGVQSLTGMTASLCKACMMGH